MLRGLNTGMQQINCCKYDETMKEKVSKIKQSFNTVMFLEWQYIYLSCWFDDSFTTQIFQSFAKVLHVNFKHYVRREISACKPWKGKMTFNQLNEILKNIAIKVMKLEKDPVLKKQRYQENIKHKLD